TERGYQRSGHAEGGEGRGGRDRRRGRDRRGARDRRGGKGGAGGQRGARAGGSLVHEVLSGTEKGGRGAGSPWAAQSGQPRQTALITARSNRPRHVRSARL